MIASRAPEGGAHVVGLSLGGYVGAEDVDGYRSAARATTRQAFRKVNDEALRFRLPDRAKESPCPVLAVAGENEHDLTRRSLAEIAAAFPAGEACLAPGVGHAWNGEKPGLFTAMIRSRITGGPLPGELTAVGPLAGAP